MHSTLILLGVFILTIPHITSHPPPTHQDDEEVLELSELSWTVYNTNKSIIIPAVVPGQIHMDLLRAGVIEEPYVGINELYQRWIAYEPTWTYTASLHNLAAWNRYKKYYLRFDGLDTPWNITLGNHHIGTAANQFRQWVFDVTDVLDETLKRDDVINITITFRSPVKYAREVRDRSEVFPSVAETQYVFPNREYIRKIQSDFGWDWGPAFSPVGIWKPAYLIGLGSSSEKIGCDNHGSELDTLIDANQEEQICVQPNTGSHCDVHELNTFIDIYRRGQIPNIPPDQSAPWIVNVSISLLSSDIFQNPTMVLSLPELGITSENLRVDRINVGKNYVNAHIIVENGLPQLWWPWNLGKPSLYNLTINLLPSPTSRPLIYSKRRQTLSHGGPYTPGDQFHFEINGKTMYTKGSNWVPADSFQSRISSEKRWRLLTSAVQSNMNMIRVWGGGLYEADELYDFADELGLLMWSELQFSVSLYPTDKSFVENVIPEVEYNVRRLNRHPSLALWAANNEIEWFVERVNQTFPSNGTHYLDEYNYLFVDTLQHVVKSITRSITYLHSSTSQGYLTGPNPWIARYLNKTQGELYGSSENWNFKVEIAEDVGRYPKSRFVNEFGFHSMPSIHSWDEVLESPDDFRFNSSVIVARNRKPPAGSTEWPNPNSPIGMGEMTRAVMSHYPIPSRHNPRENFTMWCHATQLFQAQFMQWQIQYYRLGAGQPENNLGSIVWQFNDIWQAPSWSGIEYNLIWKVVQYHIARVYHPVIISPIYNITSKSLSVYVTSDLQSPIIGTAKRTWYTWTGDKISSVSTDFTAHPLNNSLVWRTSGTDDMVPQGYHVRDVWLLLEVTARDRQGREYKHENYFTPAGLTSAKLQNPHLSLAPSTTNSKTIIIESKGGVAVYAWLDHPSCLKGHFSDNSVFVIPGFPREISFEEWSNDCKGDWRDKVKM
ncbi:hypothetical protein SpCBS45565_g05388 [Spizellomyces sp. 'palustris']|nr:hypothetical protein SpCBS45565_g05388 [Spizellomyces sp. 'palustris']